MQVRAMAQQYWLPHQMNQQEQPVQAYDELAIQAMFRAEEEHYAGNLIFSDEEFEEASHSSQEHQL